MIIALIGNQNCGKTTLFNQMTGSNQHVGNFPGVTVDRKEGSVRRHKEVTVVDLPGIYSLSPYSQEELLTREFLIREKPDAVINIIDAGNIERNLYLTLQLLVMDIPMVMAFNMMDEVRASGGVIRTDKVAEALGCPVIPISAGKNEGVDELIDEAVRVASIRQKPRHVDFCDGAVHRTIHSVAHLIEDHAQRIGVSTRFAAVKIVEGDAILLRDLSLSDNELETLDHLIREMEKETQSDRKAAIADMRYSFLETLVHNTVTKPAESVQHRRSVAIDRVLTNRFLAIPLFLLIMSFVFYMTFGLVGPSLSALLGSAIEWLTDLTRVQMTAAAFNPVLVSLVCDGIFSGVGSVLSFLPTIVLLFFFLSILEDSGYMTRVAFVMDRLLRKIGLSGRSLVPMLIGFGCTVPAVMATRTLSGERDRKMTILLTAFFSCSAKLPIYGMITSAFFPHQAAYVMIALYVGGIVFAILTGLVMKKTLFRGVSSPFVMELPNYRLPGIKTVALLLYDKAKDFITKAFTLIFIASIAVWFLTGFDWRMNVVSDQTDGMLAQIGRAIAPAFSPLGLGDWRAVTALITGFVSKETVVSTLTVLTKSTAVSLPMALENMLTPAAGASFLTFSLLYTPCIAAIAAVRRETGSRMTALNLVVFQTVLAWAAAFVVYRIAGAFM